MVGKGNLFFKKHNFCSVAVHVLRLVNMKWFPSLLLFLPTENRKKIRFLF